MSGIENAKDKRKRRWYPREEGSRTQKRERIKEAQSGSSERRQSKVSCAVCVMESTRKEAQAQTLLISKDQLLV
jgi:hypothetical protein